MKISSNNYVGFPHMFHVDMLDDSSPNCVDGTDSSPWFTLNKNQGLGFLGLGSVNDWSPWTSKWIWKNKRCEDEIFEYTVYIYIWEVPIARPCLVDEPILQKCLHDQLFWFLKFDYWIYQFVMFVVSLSSCTVVLMSFFRNYWFLDPVDDLQSLIVLHVTWINYWLVNCYDLARLEKAPLWKAMK